MRINKTYRSLLVLALVLMQGVAHGQGNSLSIDSCFVKAKRNFPAIKQMKILERSEAFALSNANKNYWPKLSVNGQASYQSDVTSLPVELPNIDVPKVSKDQYKIYGELVQPLTDLLVVKHQKDLISAEREVKAQALEVDLYKLNEQVNQLFFGILLVDAQLARISTIQADLEAGLKRSKTAIENGVATKSSVYTLQAELLKLDQRRIGLKHSKEGAIHMLSQLLGEPIDPEVKLVVPKAVEVGLDNHRAELKLFDLQKSSLEARSKLIDANNYPRIFLFGQSGYGRPALNMLNNDLDFYYIAGVKMSWNLSNFYTSSNNHQLIKYGQRALDIQKETFLFNSDLQLHKQRAELSKMDALIASDEQIVNLESKIKEANKAQLENGTISTTDYVRQVNEEDRARQNMEVHRIQKLLIQYNYNNVLAN